MSAGKIQRNPATGKVKRSPTNGKLRRNTASITTCCCTAGGVSCYRAYKCIDDSASSIYRATGSVSLTSAYKISGVCYYFGGTAIVTTDTGESLASSWAGCAECVADAGDETCETCTAGYHSGLPSSVEIEAVSACGYDLLNVVINKNWANDCGYTGGGTWTNGMGGFDPAVITITYSSSTCKYTMVITKSGFSGGSGTGTYEHDAFDDPLLAQGPRGDYIKVSSTGLCTWSDTVSVVPP